MTRAGDEGARPWETRTFEITITLEKVYWPDW